MHLWYVVAFLFSCPLKTIQIIHTPNKAATGFRPAALISHITAWVERPVVGRDKKLRKTGVFSFLLKWTEWSVLIYMKKKPTTTTMSSSVLCEHLVNLV